MRKRAEYVTGTDQRNQLLFEHYLHIVEKYKDYPRKVPIGIMVAEAAETFCISAYTANKAIRCILNESGRHKYLLPCECDELLNQLKSIRYCKIEQNMEGLNKILVLVGISKTHDEVKKLVQDYLIKTA